MSNNMEKKISVNSHLFKYRALKQYFFWFLFAQMPLVAFLFFEGMKRESVGLCVVALGAFFFFLMQAYLCIINNLNICIDANGMSRCLGGVTLQNIAWNNIKCIEAFDVFERTKSKKNLALNIYPIYKTSPRLTISGKIVVADGEMVDGKFSDLIVLINKYVDIHKVKIEKVIDGVKTFPDHLGD